ncbi:hypothetical protein C1M55_31590 (plasmid) [Rhodococcus qingshengii]|uniref:AAA family ATPase n=1 Tax=Rhodococcus TaxID=1827 RepID=UPI000976DF54|nr:MULTISPECIES: AAA family ATPase [Rhodococcus]AUS30093.1 hypothetical protein C1M55_02515 [Rhodococcus qingshengii]AUS35800.1 hypothetical protein C1M55_31590 [Rhodococcus qingshengii]OMQ31533.1 hypothetical protein BK799_20940 [Rhodococcus sp. D-1]
MIDRNCERPLEANEEPSQETNRRQSAGSVSDSSAANPENAWQTDPYADLPHPADTPEAEARDIHEIHVTTELSKMLVREEARDRLNARKNADLLKSITAPISLVEFLAIPDEPAKYRIDELFPVGGRIMLSAQFKAGKTTTVGNLIRSLVDGDDFLGKFATHKVGRVTLLDNELDARTLRSWLRDQKIQNTASVHVQPMRGRVGTFNIIDPTVRARWAKMLQGTDLLILDVLRPVLDALGLDENRDAGKFLVAFDALLADAGIQEAAVIHHMGHSGERSRGDSRLQDWPDALWRLVRQSEEPNSARYFSAFGRDVDIAEGLLAYDVRNRSLTYASGSRKDAVEAAAIPDIIDFLKTNPGASGREIEFEMTTHRNHTQKAQREALKSAISSGKIHTQLGPKRAKLHYITQVPAANLTA